MNRSDSEHERVRDAYPYDCTSEATLDDAPRQAMPANGNPVLTDICPVKRPAQKHLHL